MKLIQESPEHHFLTFLDKIKSDPGGWIGFHFALSEKLRHGELIADPDQIKNKLDKLRAESEVFVKELAEKAKDDNLSMLYRFSDGDLIFLSRPGNDQQRAKLDKIYQDAVKKLGTKICTKTNLTKDIYSYQKLADSRFLAASRLKAYTDMADGNRVASIPLRRERRDDSVIMVVEDDRFTATYASNILNKEFDVVISKTGEEAISHYVEHAPDIVFLDIHLPGLDGIRTLRAIRKIDPQAVVIMLSVDTVKQNIVGATEGGATGFLKKPFGKERLLAAVEKSPFIKARKK